eukprot:gnl/TRDRNA2_/TRDRNA2_174140_c0_seq13.p1 gnl/TRDRNA2_/TRDRNA2_174140_c0~~gnl/TRDRNA2_/TRDRNA2_174140_c0_seq13.p1  ORF type:complete len:795 (+),score=145.53 gnl/TRDRNA2_/TRDRNA2_174140_c0_seq13:115-2499(+)
MSWKRRPKPIDERRTGRLRWLDENTFKAEFERNNINDDSIEDWEVWMDDKIDKKFSGGRKPNNLVVQELNFSRNDIGDEGVRTIVAYLRERRISVITLKFFHNQLGDNAAWELGQLIAASPDPVQEVHLSHNYISEKGARWIFEAISRSQRYPYVKEDGKGSAPIWLRMEHNCINWTAVEPRLKQQDVSWLATEKKEEWTTKNNPPMVCMHDSYKEQDLDADGQPLPSKRKSAKPRKEASERDWGVDDVAAKKQQRQNQTSQRNGTSSRARTTRQKFSERNVISEEDSDSGMSASSNPMYIFLDASAVLMMMKEKEGLFCFQGLLNLCQHGHMMCYPPLKASLPEWFGKVEESERIIFLLTDYVLDELQEIADNYPRERKNIEWLKRDENSYLHTCHVWGILEVLDAKLHTQLMKLNSDQEKRASQLDVSRRMMMLIDFACLWESQIDAEGRVFLMTSDSNMYRFASEVSADVAKRAGGKSLVIAHTAEIEDRFVDDQKHGGSLLFDAAQREQVSKFCGATLSASVMSALAITQNGHARPVSHPSKRREDEEIHPPKRHEEPKETPPPKRHEERRRHEEAQPPKKHEERRGHDEAQPPKRHEERRGHDDMYPPKRHEERRGYEETQPPKRREERRGHDDMYPPKRDEEPRAHQETQPLKRHQEPPSSPDEAPRSAPKETLPPKKHQEPSRASQEEPRSVPKGHQEAQHQEKPKSFQEPPRRSPPKLHQAKPADNDNGLSEIELLRNELEKGIELLTNATRLWTSGGTGRDVTNCWEELTDAHERWQELVDGKRD